MDYGAYPGSNAISIVPDASGPPADLWAQGDNDQPVWATDDDYDDTVSNYDSWALGAGSEQPLSKKSRNSQGNSQGTAGSKALGKMFFKTKLCSKFRAGTCPYTTNCNFAHGLEELRKPPPNWQEIVATQEEGYLEPREEHQIPTSSTTIVIGETERSYKARRCKKFYTDEGCPYGDSCTFLHDEQSKARESVAINLSATVGSASYGGGTNAPNQKPSNWKTRMCNKWEMTGYCPFGSKCHFAHGTAELHRYDGAPNEMDGRDAPSIASESKQVGTTSKAPSDNIIALTATVPHADMYHIGVPSQRSNVVIQRQAQRPVEKWKGPDKISKIYGDWIDDFE